MGEIDFLKRRKESPRRRDFSIEYTRPTESRPPTRKPSKPPKNNHKPRPVPQTPETPKEPHEPWLDINLLQQEEGKKLVGLSKIALFSFIIVILLYLGLVLWQATQVTSVKQMRREIKELEEKILTFRPLQEKVNVFAERLNAGLNLWEKHVYWTKFFTELEKYTLPETSYTSFLGNVAGVITLQTETSSFEAITRQLQAFNQASFIEKAETNNISQEINPETGERKVRYNLSLTVKTDVFYR